MRLLRLCLGQDGMVWFGIEGVLGETSHLPPDKFFELGSARDLVCASTAVHLPGDRRHCRLAAMVYDTVLRTEAKTQVVAFSPACHGKLWREPEAALHMLWQPDVSLHAAGQRITAGNGEYAAWCLTAAVDAANTAEVQRMLPFHPAFPALAFIPEIKMEAAARVLARIVDPRWFLHPTRPGRPTRVYAALGLSEHNARYAAGLAPRLGRAHLPFCDVLACWLHKGAYDHRPQDFLERVRQSKSDPADGLLAASRRFMLLVWLYWLGRVFRPSQEQVFMPERFFAGRDDEQAAFERHMLGMPGDNLFDYGYL